MLTDVLTVDQGTTMQLYRTTIRGAENMMVFGPAGIGKTEMAEQAAALEGFDYRYLNLSVLEAPDLLGLPQIIDNQTVYATPKMLPLAGQGRPVVLVVDELDKAKPELQNPMLELFQYRSINGVPLNIHAVLATGNMPDENAFSRPVSHALMNRCGVFVVKSAFEPWQEWAAGAGINPLIVGFLSRNSEFLLKKPADGDETAYCHPSPRAWSKAAKALDANPDADIDFQSMIVAGRVGNAAAVKFRVWLEHYRYVEPIIKALVEKGAHPPDMASDRMLVCALAAANAVMIKCRDVESAKKATHDKELEKLVANTFGWLKLLPGEFIIMAAKSILTMEIIGKFKLTRFPDFMQSFMKIKDALKEGR